MPAGYWPVSQRPTARPAARPPRMQTWLRRREQSPDCRRSPPRCTATPTRRPPPGGARNWRLMQSWPARPGPFAAASGTRQAASGKHRGQAAAQVARQISAELRAGCWPALSARLALIELAARPARAAAGVRAVARAMEERGVTASFPALPGPGTDAEPAAAEPPDTGPDRAGNQQPGPGTLADRARLARWERAARAGELAWRLRAELARAAAGAGTAEAAGTRAVAAGGPPPGQVRSPSGELIPDEVVGWLRRMTGVRVLSNAFERRLARRMGPDVFGLLTLPAAPAFLAAADPAALSPEHVAPFLRAISMTPPPPPPAPPAPPPPRPPPPPPPP